MKKTIVFLQEASRNDSLLHVPIENTPRPLLFMLVSMAFLSCGLYYGIRTNFIPESETYLFSQIISSVISIPYSLSIYILIKNKPPKVGRLVIPLAVYGFVVFCYFYTLAYSLPSMYTAYFFDDFEEKHVVSRKFEAGNFDYNRETGDCPDKILIDNFGSSNRTVDICIPYKEISQISVNDEIIIKGRESIFGKKIDKVTTQF